MKKVLKAIPAVLIGLLMAYGLIAVIVRGILYEDERNVMLIAVGIIVLFALVAIIGIRRTSRIKRKAIAQTSGVIIHARRRLSGDEYDTDAGWWFRIRYSVDQQEYQITRHDRFGFGVNARQYVNKPVTVHYDPDDPKTAWAEMPWEKSK